MSKKTGGCLCGKVKFSTTSENRKVGVCHCSMCRRSASGPFMAVDCGGDVKFASKDHVTTYSSSSYGERGFCKSCGSTLFWKMKGQENYIMSAGTFDDQSDFSMKNQIFIDYKPGYYEFANKTEKMTEQQFLAQFK